MKYDAIIIGSGLGGLSAGALLAKNGKKVIVLEQHALIGGCATCFQRKGTLIDASLHEMDFGSPLTDMKHHIFEQLGIDQKVQFIPLPNAWSIFTSNQIFTIPHQKTKQALTKLFPDQKKGIARYFFQIKLQAFAFRKFPFDLNLFECLLAPFSLFLVIAFNLLTQRNVGGVLQSLISNPHLQRILTINLAYYHHNPFKLIWSYHAIAQKHYYDQGVYIKGGSQSLSLALAQIIQENNGTVLNNAQVFAIHTHNQKATGISYYASKQTHTIQADTIIANCDPSLVYHEFLKDSKINLSRDLQASKDLEISTSLASLHLIFNQNISEIYPQMDYANFLTEEEIFNAPFDQEHTNCQNIPLAKRDIAFVNYSKIQSGLSSNNNRFLATCTLFSSIDEWEGDYQEKKAQLIQILTKRLEQHFPNIMQYCIHAELATPKTIAHYTKTRKGTPYGYDQNQEGETKRESYRSKSIKNLYFASAFTFPGGGFTGAILGGYKTAKMILDPYFAYKKTAILIGLGSLCYLLWNLKAY